MRVLGRTRVKSTRIVGAFNRSTAAINSIVGRSRLMSMRLGASGTSTSVALRMALRTTESWPGGVSMTMWLVSVAKLGKPLV